MKKLIVLTAVCAAAVYHADADVTWANTGTDMLDSSSYVEGCVPDAGDVVFFTTKPVTQPYLSASLGVKGLYFGPHYSSKGEREEENKTVGDKAGGYVLTGAPDAVLTLYGTSEPMAIGMGTTGTILIDVPVEFFTKEANFGGSGGELILAKPISCNAGGSVRVATDALGVSGGYVHGWCTLAAANPNFKPTELLCSYATDCRLAHPQAVMNVPVLTSGHWGGSQETYFRNISGETIVWDSLVKIDGESHGHNGFHFEGDPIVMTNCVFQLSMRETKSRYANAAVSFKCVKAVDYSGESFVKSGSNMWEVVENYIESPDIVNHILIRDGMYYPHNIFDGAIREGRRFRLNGDGGLNPTLGVNCDVRIPVADIGGISFGKDSEQKGGGFSGMDGAWRVTLTDESDNQLTITNDTKTSAGKGYVSAYPWVFGNVSATGTAILMNDINFNGRDANVTAIKGLANVDGRFAGEVRTKGTSTDNKGLIKNGNGVLAFDKMLDVYNTSTINAGGVLINCVCTNANWTVKNSGWLGGTGSVRQATVQTGGALGCGEFGKGVFTITGVGSDTTFASGAGIIAHFEDGQTGYIDFRGSEKKYTSPGTNFIQVVVKPDAPIVGSSKIMDWSNYSGNKDACTLFNIDNFKDDLRFDSNIVSRVKVKQVASTIWVSYACKALGFQVFVR